jgi:hypothetical protein
MGINDELLGYMLRNIDNCGININGCRMVELGNQHFKGSDGKDTGRAAKNYFQSFGVDHVSIDTNGKDGALNIDLQKEITDTNLVGTFDVLTNFGTIEHVRQQYPCWLNVHNLVKKGGIFIHVTPRVGHWGNHGIYRYSRSFFQKLSEACEYVILENFVMPYRPKKDFVCCSMIKKADNKFVSNAVFDTLGVMGK